MSTAVQAEPDVRRDTPLVTASRIVSDGKFLRYATDDASTGERYLVKGVTYGTFAPNADG